MRMYTYMYKEPWLNLLGGSFLESSPPKVMFYMTVGLCTVQSEQTPAVLIHTDKTLQAK